MATFPKQLGAAMSPADVSAPLTQVVYDDSDIYS